MLGKNFFIDARLGLNKILFPTYSERRQPAVADRQRDRHRLRQLPDRYRPQPRPLSGQRHRPVLRRSGARRPARVQVRLRLLARGRPEREHPRRRRAHVLQQPLTPRSAERELYATPLIDRSALDVLALFAQDSYSVKRLTLTGGLRWERLEGYLPEQSSPPSRVLSEPFSAASRKRATWCCGTRRARAPARSTT